MEEFKTKNKIIRNRHRFLALGMLSISAVAIYLIVSPFFPENGSREYQVAYAFLTAQLNGEQETASQYLSTNIMAIAQTKCRDSEPSACFNDLIDNSWGAMEGIYFVSGSGSRNTYLFHIFFSGNDKPISIVLFLKKEEQDWVIDGWRGFQPSEGEVADSQLLKGIRNDNQFP